MDDNSLPEKILSRGINTNW